MRLYRNVAWIAGASFVACLVAAYGAALAGLLGLLDARTVSLWTISGGSAAFLAAVGYFLASAQGVRRAFIALNGQPG